MAAASRCFRQMRDKPPALNHPRPYTEPEVRHVLARPLRTPAHQRGVPARLPRKRSALRQAILDTAGRAPPVLAAAAPFSYTEARAI